jgi:hypothetical protein
MIQLYERYQGKRKNKYSAIFLACMVLETHPKLKKKNDYDDSDKYASYIIYSGRKRKIK